MTDPEWFVYIIEAEDGTFYTGVSTDVERRFRDHESGPRGARYFAGRTPKRIAWVESGHDRSSAHKREALIKKMSRSEKQMLIQSAAADR